MIGPRVNGLGGGVVEKDRRLGCSEFWGSEEDCGVDVMGCGRSFEDKELRPKAMEVIDNDFRKVGRIDARFAAGTAVSIIWAW